MRVTVSIVEFDETTVRLEERPLSPTVHLEAGDLQTGTTLHLYGSPEGMADWLDAARQALEKAYPTPPPGGPL